MTKCIPRERCGRVNVAQTFQHLYGNGRNLVSSSDANRLRLHDGSEGTFAENLSQRQSANQNETVPDSILYAEQRLRKRRREPVKVAYNAAH